MSKKSNSKCVAASDISIGYHETKGERSTMEDTHLMSKLEDHDIWIFAIFDGHNGPKCARYLKDHLTGVLNNYLPVGFRPPVSSTASSVLSVTTPVNTPAGEMQDVIKKTFCTLDKNWITHAQTEDSNDGSTALCVFIQNHQIIVANTGDCRALMKSAGKCVVLSRDHKADDPEEMKRIKENGGEVIGGRLQGELALSRAFGDLKFKNSDQKFLICDPDINKMTLKADIDFIVVACDGLYETFSNDEVIEFISRLLSASIDINLIAKNLAEEAIDRGSKDNITIIIIKFEKKLKKLLASKETRPKRKSLDICYKSLNYDFTKKRPFRPSDGYDEIDSESDGSDSHHDPAVTFESCLEPDIKLKIKKKDQGSKSKSTKKSCRKNTTLTMMVKKCKSKDDIPKETKKAKVGRRRSKSDDTPQILKDINNFSQEKRSKKKQQQHDYGSDDFEKELIKSFKKKEKNGMSLKCPNDPTYALRSTMNESLLSKHKPKKPENASTVKTSQESSIPTIVDTSSSNQNKTISNCSGDRKSCQKTSIFLSDGNTSNNSKSRSSTSDKSAKFLASDYSPKVDQLQSHKTTQYVCKKHH